MRNPTSNQLRDVCVIGGSRYFGLHLVTLLRDSGARVTVINRGSTPPPPGVDHVVADRSDEAGLTAALGARTFDAVIDQVLYTPAEAAVARRVFDGRTGRYVMTSTMEVYDPATSPLVRTAPGVPVSEDTVDPLRPGAAGPDAAWSGAARSGAAGLGANRQPAADRYPDEATRYAEGKRRAEAVLAQDAPFSWASVRSAHVLGGGARDFTGRLAHYVERIAAGRPIAVHEQPQPTSFVQHREIAAALVELAGSTATGAVNACSAEPLDVVALCELVADRLGTTARYREATGADASPFSFDRWYPMDQRRAAGLGLHFSPLAQWLPGAVAEAVADAAAGDAAVLTPGRAA
ncbi:reductase [Kitasatospora sp. NBC_01560]|uniref:reductase n=1 Tax=Kitasatospora sp. NBC_01560 TaxID=2975965 RepID=UPI00386F5679